MHHLIISAIHCTRYFISFPSGNTKKERSVYFTASFVSLAACKPLICIEYPRQRYASSHAIKDVFVLLLLQPLITYSLCSALDQVTHRLQYITSRLRQIETFHCLHFVLSSREIPSHTAVNCCIVLHHLLVIYYVYYWKVSTTSYSVAKILVGPLFTTKIDY